ncbi:MAG TPA: Uma2 family endonuclease [Balneolaceae bacterium]|nr:Uma2 family endonuclease [Balneolaceae bacterium]
MLTKEKLVTYDDYLTLPDDGNRYEIIGGELYMSPSPSTIHQRISLKLSTHLNEYIGKKNLGEIFVAPLDVVLSMTDVVQPDLLFITNERSQIISKKNIIAAPDLIIEILSESTEAIDRNRKKKLYEKHKVKEYWIVAPDEKQLEQYILGGDCYQEKKVFKQSEILTSQVVSGFKFPLEKVFAN